MSRLLLLLAAALLACAPDARESDPAGEGSPPAGSATRFVDVTQQSGIDFVHRNGGSPRRYLPETMGSGVAVFDYDGDGLVDLYFINGAAVADPAAGPAARLYRQLGDGGFADTTKPAGLDAPFLGMGACVGDFDWDSDLDLYVTGVGSDRMFRSRGDGTFEEASTRLGLDDRGFGSSCAFFDFDRDGWLDLFAGRYVTWSPEGDVRCSPDREHATYCTPEVYPGESNRLYRNLEGRGFEDVTRRSGLFLPEGKTLGIVPLDHDRDGWPDLAVANDTVRNFLFLNQRDGTFRETGIEDGLAFSPSGSTRGGMGIDAGDLSGDGADDVVVGNFSQEMSAVYRAGAAGLFRDDAAQLGVGLPSLMTLAFGTLLLDFDADSRLDLVLANGHIEPDIARFQPQQSYAQAANVFRNLGPEAGFETVTDAGDLTLPVVARGLATGDLDRDGDQDVVLTQNGAAAHLYRNDAAPAPWLQVELTGRSSNPNGYGARLDLSSGEQSITRSLVSGRSYLSASEPIVTFGLGGVGAIDRLEVSWPSGKRQILLAPPLARRLVLVEP